MVIILNDSSRSRVFKRITSTWFFIENKYCVLFFCKKAESVNVFFVLTYAKPFYQNKHSKVAEGDLSWTANKMSLLTSGSYHSWEFYVVA